jgi:hypothetical protein
MKEAQPISKDQITPILSFLPIFTSEDFQFVTGHQRQASFLILLFLVKHMLSTKPFTTTGGSFRSIGVLGKTKQPDM